MNPKLNYRGPSNVETVSADFESNEKTVGSANNFKLSKSSSKAEPAVQKKTAEEDEKLQRKENGSSKPEVSSGFQSAVESSKGTGSQLDGQVRKSFGAKFGADFGNVKIHNNNRSHKLAREVNARAFTVGQDIYFNKGEYQPGSQAGKKLLAHELTHTIQQSGENKRVQRQDAEKVQAKRTAQTIISDQTSFYNLDEKALGIELFQLASGSMSNYRLVIEVFGELDESNQKEVSYWMIEHGSSSQISSLATTDQGIRFLKAVLAYMSVGGKQYRRLKRLIPTDQQIKEADREKAMDKLKERGNTAEVNFYPEYEGMDYAESSLAGIGNKRAEAPDVVSLGVDSFESIKVILKMISENNGNAENFIRVLHFLGHGRGGENPAFGFGEYMTGLDIVRKEDTGAYAKYMVDGGSVLMEGCSVARGANGKEYLKEIARITFGTEKSGYIRGNQCTVITSGEITTCDPITLKWPSDF